MPTERKKQQVEELTTQLDAAELVVLTDYRGLTVTDLQELRGNLRKVDGSFHIAKNTLTKIAATNAGVEGLDPVLEGPLALGFATGDIVGVAKALTSFAKSSNILTVKGGILDKQFVDVSEIEKLSALPSKETLQGKLIGTLQSPVSNIVSILGGPSRSLAYVLKARADQLAEEGGEQAA